jgi:glycosyltransferase involved in cell wall biosynthesis
MKTSDILAVPSLWPEPFGIVGIEAACLGLPAVAFPVGGIGDWLVSGESGELAVGEDRSPENFADAIVRALGDQGHWNKLRAGAWNVSKRFCIESHLLQLLDVFRRVTDSAPLNR